MNKTLSIHDDDVIVRTLGLTYVIIVALFVVMDVVYLREINNTLNCIHYYETKRT